MSGFCYIVGAGDFFEERPFELTKEDFLIAADGGLRHLRGREPDLLIGDFDSLGEPAFSGETVRLPKEKDETDLLAAIREGISRGYRKFLMFGATGGRFGHTFANLQCLSYLKRRGCRGWIFDRTCVMTVISGESVRFPAGFRGYFSAFSITDRSRVTETGFAYPISGKTLDNGYPLGVSNEFTGTEAEISAEEGEVLILYERRNLASFAQVL